MSASYWSASSGFRLLGQAIIVIDIIITINYY